MKASGRALSLETPGSPTPPGAALPAAMSFVLVGSTQSSPGQQAAVATSCPRTLKRAGTLLWLSSKPSHPPGLHRMNRLWAMLDHKPCLDVVPERGS